MVEKITRITVDAGNTPGALAHNWTYIGYDEINYTHTPEGKELLEKFSGMGDGPYYVRAHHLLCTGNGHAAYKWGSTNVYVEDEAGNPAYDWTIVDLVLDTLLETGNKPFVELGFMPLHLASPAHYDVSKDNYKLDGYRTDGWRSPPKDYRKWYALIRTLVEHCRDRYGPEEITTWYWELWNEPDIRTYWLGTPEEFNTLYDYTAAAVKSVSSGLRVGGPGTTHPVAGAKSAAFLDGFLNHCVNGENACTGEKGTPLDFITFHVKGAGYRADPLHRQVKPPKVDAVVTGVATGYDIIASYPGLEMFECVLSEIDPDGWAAGGMLDNAALNFRNTEYYPSFTAAAFDKVSAFARTKEWDLKLQSWAFLFVGERCFEGTRAFSTQGIDKPVLNLFRLYAQLGKTVLPVSADGNPDVGCVASRVDDGTVALLVYNHNDDWDRTGTDTVGLEIGNCPAGATVRCRLCRLDAEHANTYAEWVRQAKPWYPDPAQRDRMEAAGMLESADTGPYEAAKDGMLRIDVMLPVHGMALLVLSGV